MMQSANLEVPADNMTDSNQNQPLTLRRKKSFLAPTPTMELQDKSVPKEFLVSGSKLLKLSKGSSKTQERLVKFELYPLMLLCERKDKSFKKIPLEKILEIRIGQNTKGFADYQRYQVELGKVIPEDYCFSVLYMEKGKHKELNLLTHTASEREYWISAINELLTQLNTTVHDEVGLPEWLREIWDAADVDKSGSLDLDEITTLMNRLKLPLSKSEIKSAFKLSKINKKSSLSFEQFEKLYSNFRFRPEIAELFLTLVNNSNPQGILFGDFYNFITKTQKENMSVEKCQEIFNKFSAVGSNSMDMNHFTAFLMSSKNTIFNKNYASIHQDMDQPLCRYFINSSHNTYLIGDQIVGDSSVEGYIRALQKGCKCVELDCWDGPNGEPIIYHGRTLTSRILFQSVISAVLKYAFVVSDFPLILSLETHCSTEQQHRMAEILINTLGDKLLREPVSGLDSGTLPSPSRLMNKIIVKGKVTSPDEEMEVSPKALRIPLLKRQDRVSNSMPDMSKSSDSSSPLKEYFNMESDSDLHLKKGTPRKLADLFVYIQGVSSKGMDMLEDRLEYNQVFSFSDKKASNFILKQGELLSRIADEKLIRVYPSVMRVTSSNYDPLPFWKAGLQMVALNFQTHDLPLQLNTALFDMNGACGYVLKPVAKPPMEITIKIISGQQIHRPSEPDTKPESVNCYVQVEMIEPNNISKFRTKEQKSDSLRPLFNEECRFTVSNPALCFLKFEVISSENVKSSIGHFVISLECLQEGFRHIPLNDKKGIIGFSTLFVKLNKTCL